MWQLLYWWGLRFNTSSKEGFGGWYKMTYACRECGAEVEYEYLQSHKLKCTKCKERRSNIWIKKRPPITKKIIGR